MIFIRCMCLPSSTSLLTLLALVHCCTQTDGFKLFKEKHDSSSDEPAAAAAAISTGDTPSMFVSDSVKSGARSAYQLAPFGQGFGFADLFGLFGKHISGEPGRDQMPFQLDDNLIPINDGTPPSPIGVLQGEHGKEKANQKDAVTYYHEPTMEARMLKLGPWNGIILANNRQPSDNERPTNQSSKSTSSFSSPIILVPGYGGSRLEAKLDKTSSVHYFCDSKTDWTDLWINVKQLLPYMIDCLIDNMRLEFDPASNKTRNPAGVEIRVKNGSQIASVEYLNNLQISGFAYFAPIIEQLTEGKLAYERELNIRAAPYDFRKAPNELGDYFDNLKQSSEQLVKERAGRPITFICHSMGCNNMLYFLQRQSNEWKSMHVSRLISIAAPWAGSVSAMRAAAVGDDLGMPYLFSESKLLLVQRSLPSTIFLFPHRRAFSGIPLITSNVEHLSDKISKTKQQNLQDKQPKGLATDGTTNNRLKTRSLKSESKLQPNVYTADDFEKFFEDINHPDGYRMWLDTKDLLGSLEAPGVEVWCLVGGGKRTLARIEYSGEFPTSDSRELYDDGDGTVTTQSADYCKRWSTEQKQPIYYKQFNTDHLAILKDANVLQYIESILESDHANNNY